MTTFDQIKQTELQIERLKTSIANAENSRAKEKLSKQLNAEELEQETAVMNYLESNDRAYDAITQESFDLLINDEIEFVVTREDWRLLTSHARRLSGNVHGNGFFYANTMETDFALLNFYPTGYHGLVNYLGEAELQITRKVFSLFGNTVPTRFKGSIDRKGSIQMEPMDSYWDRNGTIYVNRIIGDFFSGDGDKRNRFLNNRGKLKAMISDFRSTLC